MSLNQDNVFRSECNFWSSWWCPSISIYKQLSNLNSLQSVNRNKSKYLKISYHFKKCFEVSTLFSISTTLCMKLFIIREVRFLFITNELRKLSSTFSFSSFSFFKVYSNLFFLSMSIWSWYIVNIGHNQNQWKSLWSNSSNLNSRESSIVSFVLLGLS